VNCPTPSRNQRGGPASKRNAKAVIFKEDIDCFTREDSLARVTHSEDIKGVHMAHNSGRARRQKEKMVEVRNVCQKYKVIVHKKEYLALIGSLMLLIVRNLNGFEFLSVPV